MPVMNKKAKWRCPHCRWPLIIRTSEEVHALLRHEYLACSNLVCGFTGSAGNELMYQLSPSALPNPAVSLPIAPSKMRAALMRASDEQSDLFYDGNEEDEDESI